MEKFCFLRDASSYLNMCCKYFFLSLFGNFEHLYQQVVIPDSYVLQIPSFGSQGLSVVIW